MSDVFDTITLSKDEFSSYTPITETDEPDWDKYASYSQEYLNRPKFKNTPLKGSILASAAKNAFQKTKRYVTLVHDLA